MSDSGPQPRRYTVPEVRNLREALEQMLPTVPGVVYRCKNDPNWTMVDVAEDIEDLTGYGPEAFLGNAELSFGDLIHEEDRDRVWEEVQTALEQGLAFRTFYRIRARDGAIRWVWEHGRAVRHGAADELTGLIQDVTEWRGTWQDLRHTQALLEQTVAALDEAVIIIDSRHSGRGVVSANPAAVAMFGYSEDELVGGSTEQLHVSREAFERFARELNPELIRTGEVQASFPMRRKDGTEFQAQQTVRLLEPERGLEGGAVSVIRDVSERRSLEQQLRQSQKLQAVGRLAGGVAHDFNNLLTVVRAHTDFLLMELDENDGLEKEVEAIQEAVDSAAGLTQQLLAFSREQVLRPEVVEVNAVIRNVERLLGRVLEENIRIHTDLYGEDLCIRVDPNNLEQALVNLAVNARDAMPGGGTLTLATRSIQDPEGLGQAIQAQLPASEPGQGPWVQLLVSDSGHGMDETTRSRVFEPFFTTKAKGEGSGLGLATTYGFVTQSGGAIIVESEPGEGATFILTFPGVDERPTPAAARKLDRVLDLGSATILVVEDDANVRRVVRRTLERAGCSVTATETGEEGIARWDAEAPSFDLVLTDLVLPGVSGRAVVERVLSAAHPVPVVVMSGYDADSPGHGDDLPAEVEFIQKPFTPAALVDTIQQVLAGA